MSSYPSFGSMPYGEKAMVIVQIDFVPSGTISEFTMARWQYVIDLRTKVRNLTHWELGDMWPREEIVLFHENRILYDTMQIYPFRDPVSDIIYIDCLRSRPSDVHEAG